MRLLAIDCASGAPGVALAGPGDLLDERIGEAGEPVETALPRLIAALAARLEGGVLSIDRLAVVTGPGGFTGVRAGVAAAKALALAIPARVHPLTAFDVLASAAREAGIAPPFLLAHDGRRGDVMTRSWPPGVGLGEEAGLRRLEPGTLGDLAPIVCAQGAFGGPAGALAGKDVRFLAITPRHAVLAARQQIEDGLLPIDGSDVRPFYLRPADVREGAGQSLLAGRP